MEEAIRRDHDRDVRLAPEHVDASIGSAGAYDAHRVAQERTRGRSDHALHRRHVALDLPARVRGAVVRQLETEDAPRGAYRSRSSAICTALVAAPLRS